MTIVRRTAIVGLLALSLAGAAGPAASARPVGGDSPFTSVGTPRPVVRIEMAPSGFHWGDAGIGAAGGIALSLIAAGSVLGTAQYRTRRERGTAALS
jgi:hypothetical protein